jgi:signal transduction histidine kinase
VIQFAVIVAAATLAGGLAAALAVRALPTVRLQLVAFGLAVVALPLAAVLLSGLVMFESGHDLTVLAIAVGASTAALVGAAALARAVAGGLDGLRRAAARIAHGELRARADVPPQRELREVALAFNEMAARLEHLFDARTQLVTWASHDLRTPLASMQAMLEALEDGLAEPERYLPALREQVRALGILVDDLFELARIDAGALTLELREARLRGLVETCLRGLEAEAAQKRVVLEADVAGELTVLCAPEKIERVLFNLLANALRHTPSDGSVAVRAGGADGAVRVSVEDTGEGIDPGAADRMFERFWRGDRARSGGGAGLGLAIARALVEAHGGTIWAESRPGGGARISFTLPAPSS